MMAAGNRVDLLMKAPSTPGLYPVMVQHAVDPSDLSSAIPVVLLQVRVAGDPAKGNLATFIDKDNFPKPPPFQVNIADAEVTGSTITATGRRYDRDHRQPARRHVRVHAAEFPAVQPTANNPNSYAMHTINGTKFQEGDPANVFAVNQGAVEEWKIVNATFGPPISHPFHIHINPFQIIEVFDPNATVSDPAIGTMPKYVFNGSALQSPGCNARSIRRTRAPGWTATRIPRTRRASGGTCSRFRQGRVQPNGKPPFPVTSACAAASSITAGSTCSTATSWRMRIAA